MSHAKHRRRLMQWERYHVRHPQSGKYKIGCCRYHTAHVLAQDLCTVSGRYAPIGIRTVWTLPHREMGT